MYISQYSCEKMTWKKSCEWGIITLEPSRPQSPIHPAKKGFQLYVTDVLGTRHPAVEKHRAIRDSLNIEGGETDTEQSM